jgi:hypothetical protein
MDTKASPSTEVEADDEVVSSLRPVSVEGGGGGGVVLDAQVEVKRRRRHRA